MKISDFNEQEQLIICLYGYSKGFYTVTANLIYALFKQLGITITPPLAFDDTMSQSQNESDIQAPQNGMTYIMQQLEILKNLDVLRTDARPHIGREIYYIITPPYELEAIRFLHTQHFNDWVPAFKIAFPLNNKDTSNSIQEFKRWVIGHYDMDISHTIRHSIDSEQCELILVIFDHPDWLWLVRSLDYTEFSSCMNQLIRISQNKDTILNWNYLKQLNAEFVPDVKSAYYTSLRPLNNGLNTSSQEFFPVMYFLATGTECMPYSATSHGGYIYAAVHELYAGRYAESAALFKKALSTKYKAYCPESGVFSFFIINYLYIIALLLDNSEDSRNRLIKLLDKRTLNDRSLTQYSLLPLINYMVNGVDFMVPGYNSNIVYMALYCRYPKLLTTLIWKQLHKLEDTPMQSPCHWKFMRLEYHSLLNVSQSEMQELSSLFGGGPLLERIHIMHNWEIVLNKLIDPKTPEEEEETSQSRIIYLLNYNELEPYIQKRKKNGEWGIGKSITPEQMRNNRYDFMDERDNKMADQAVHYNTTFFGNKYFAILMGCDRVFYRSSRYSTILQPVEIKEEKPYLLVDRTIDGSFRVTSNITLDDLTTDDNVLVNKYSDICYSVTTFKPDEKNIYRSLLNIGVFPPEAEEMLKKALAVVGGRTELHSNVLANEQDAQIVEGDAHCVLRFFPLAKGVAWGLKLCVRPTLKSEHVELAGEGRLMTIVADNQGNRLQVKRNFKAEKMNLAEVTAMLTTLEFIEDASDWPLLEQCPIGVEEMLNITDWVQSHEDIAVTEMQEGAKIRIQGMVSSQQVRLNLRYKAGWFEIEGDVSINEKSVLKLQELFESLTQGHGQYIRIDDSNYLKLSENAYRTLRKMEAVICKQKDKLVMSRASVLLLDDALSGSFNIEASTELTALRKLIRESSAEEVQIPLALRAELRDYQVDGFRWMMRTTAWGAGVCLADDMGLGKTLQSITVMLATNENGPSLVVAPTSVVPNWRNELSKFAPSLQVVVLNDAEDRTSAIQNATQGMVILTTYGIMLQNEKVLSDKSWNVVCLDEAHTIKNKETKLSQAAMKLQGLRRIILTGTPIQNHLSELWNLFEFINPRLLGSFELFQKKFIVPIEQDKNRECQRQLRRIIAPFLLRRTKQEVLDELPEKNEITLPVELTKHEMTIYEAYRRKAESILTQVEKVDVSTLAEITKLRLLACSCGLVKQGWTESSSKVEALMELLQDISIGTNHALVFSQFTSFLSEVREALDHAGIAYLYLDGSTTLKKREQLVKQFQNGECPLFIISLKAGGLGLNLTNANYVIHLDPWWNPAIEQQATDRAYRIGQKNDVTVYHLIAQHTIEEKIVRMHHSKRDLADSLLEGSNMSHKLSKEDLLELITGR